MSVNCPICSSPVSSEPFYKTIQPVNENVLFNSWENAKKSKSGKISLVFCDKCSFVFNKDFRLALVDYSEQYQYTLPPSKQFMKFIKQMVASLIEDHKIKNKKIVELGCGKGEFIREICEKGSNKGFGYDTSYEGPQKILFPKLKFENRFYDRKLDENIFGDFVVARQTLEHIKNPHSFVLDMLTALEDGGKICLETPNLDWILDNCTFWDFYYEHCSYYNKTSYINLLSQHGLSVSKTYYWFDNQYMSVVAELGHDKEMIIPNSLVTKLNIEKFCQEYQKKKIRIKNFCLEKSLKGQISIWGGAAKGITFCNIFKDYLKDSVLVDINPIRQKKYVPCTGNAIISPEVLVNIKPETIIVMNHQYFGEISQTCKELGITADIVAIDLI